MMGECPATGLRVHDYPIKICNGCPYGYKDNSLKCHFYPDDYHDEKKVSEYQDKILKAFYKEYFGDKRS